MAQLLVKLLNENATSPAYLKQGDSGMDICCSEDYIIESGCRQLCNTGVALGIPDGYEIQVRSRSGLAVNHGIAVLNAPGTVDAGYTGEVKVILVNHGTSTVGFKIGDRIAQLVLAPISRAHMAIVDELPETERGSNGFGSTGE